MGKLQEAKVDGVRYRRRSDTTETSSSQHPNHPATDSDSAPARLAQPGHLVTQYIYDAQQQLSAMQDPRSNTTHDAANNVLTEEDADGNLTEHRYDAANRLIASHSADAQYRWDYNAEGRLEASRSPSVWQYYAYNRYGQVTQHQRDIDGFSFVTHYEYNPIGQLVRKILPSGDVLRHYYHEDGPRSGLIRAITKEGLWSQETIVGELNTDRDSSTQQHLRFGNGILRTIMRDELGRVANIDHEQALKQSYITTASVSVLKKSCITLRAKRRPPTTFTKTVSWLAKPTTTVDILSVESSIPFGDSNLHWHESRLFVRDTSNKLYIF